MNSVDLTPSLREFIVENIQSIEQLEILLLLRRDTRREWTADDVAREIRNNPFSGEDRLEDLFRKGLLSRRVDQQSRYQFSPATPELAKNVDALAHEYSTRRLRVIDAIYCKPKIAQKFADAFKVREREEPKDG